MANKESKNILSKGLMGDILEGASENLQKAYSNVKRFFNPPLMVHVRTDPLETLQKENNPDKLFQEFEIRYNQNDYTLAEKYLNKAVEKETDPKKLEELKLFKKVFDDEISTLEAGRKEGK